ncbi:formate/nitrite transporter family protein [Rhodalgimonas zhirmunskyi]|uniref:Formate/nitrite transporter family protein n=1 Tax=Rhodalgimonas zhirmunskyi TaxID=2964767 RepID=A0AAJ1UFP6_9RHOB|nr:formate/nitrite transporter family protein [Rhodoalgimonas zhirmunskyi]MDQ2095057.1 formate/nitrite transporter family protein [Rhodoalgimonas zhirmunskyi]
MTEEELEEKSVEQASKLAPTTVYEIIRRDGEEELERSNTSLFWSGISAGLMISFSVLGEAIFRTYLSDTPSRYLIENLGYSLGFVAVITGRMQLFTENTITTVLPLLQRPCWAIAQRTLVLWGLVLMANVIGAFLVATFYAYSGAIGADLLASFHALSEHATGMPAGEGFVRAIPAGVIVAAIVWMLPQAGPLGLFIVVLFTWLIAAGDFTHIVAGSVEMAFLVVQGDLGFGQAVFGFFLPVLAGNVLGGTVIFAMLAWGQVKVEVKSRRDHAPLFHLDLR